MIVVLDARAAVEVALDKPDADRFKRFLSTADLVLAPDIYASEITNVFWKYHSFCNLPIEICLVGIDFCINLVDDFVNTKQLCSVVFSEAVNMKHSAYDIFYLVSARENNALLLTKDQKLVSIANALHVKVAS